MKNKKETIVVQRSSPFLGLLTIMFIFLKLTNVIDWSWLWVLSPLWIPLAIIFGILIFALIMMFIITMGSLIFKR